MGDRYKRIGLTSFCVALSRVVLTEFVVIISSSFDVYSMMRLSSVRVWVHAFGLSS